VAKKYMAQEVTQAKRMVRRIIDHHCLGLNHGHGDARDRPARIKQLEGGKTNLVFFVRHASGDLIVRLGAHAAKINDFMKEQWVIAEAREKGVPTPEVLQVGNEAACVPYMISRQALGKEATFHPEKMSIIRQMGHFAAMINSIPTTGFGATFEWSLNELSHNASWTEFLENELKMEEKLEIFTTCGMLDGTRIKRLRTLLEGAAGRDRVPALNHGDLRLKNVLVNDKGAISCILDWEHSTSNLAPEWELSLALHDLSIDEKQEFLEGYGINREEISRISPVLKALTVINYAPSVEQAAKSKNSAKLEQYRVRLAGELDLYSL
jgi:aminoglycoside phosphotransferase (APT) family kinase protein